MFDIGFSELLLLAIVALVVLGPEKLPHAARIAGAWVGRLRRTVSTMQAEIEREVAAQEVRQQFEKQMREIGATDIVKDLDTERRQIEAAFSNAAAAFDPAPAPAPSTPAAAVAPSGAVDTAEPVLPKATTSPDTVQLDGEVAYREWLATQRRDNRIAPPTPADKDPAA
ncbi:MAG TPA: Sec-independent protein translocase protein TatB [Moraxellaceae bacterium]|nr:Sec-independent protein translocase protein TatB [Moraxellaceae bacterium]